MSDPTKILLVGCGNIAEQAHLPALRKLALTRELEICGVVDADGARARGIGEQYNVPHHGTSWAEVAERSGAQAVSLCLPPGLNAEVAVSALEAGLHVLCEKPPGRNLTQARTMATAAQARPKLVSMVAFNRRHAPLFRQAIERSRRWGMPQAFYGRFTRASMGQEPSNTVTDWITSDGSHVLDLAIATMGYPHSLAITRGRVGGLLDNVWTVHMASAQGGAVLLFGFAAGRRLESFEWVGPGYDVRLELPERGVWTAQGKESEDWESCQMTGSNDFDLNYGFVDEYRAFVRAIRGIGSRPETDFAYAEAFMRLVEGILGAKSGEYFQIEPGTDLAKVATPRELGIHSNGANSTRPVVALLQRVPLQARYFNAESLSQISGLAEIRHLDLETAMEGNLADVTVLVAGWGASPVPVPVLEVMRQLQLVIVLGASIQWALPAEWLQERHIPVCNTADAIASTVAEHCLLLALAGLRRLTELDSRMHRGQWPPRPNGWSWAGLVKKARKLPGAEVLKPFLRSTVAPVYHRIVAGERPSPWNDLRRQTVGLIGWGHTAKRFAELLQPFDCPILVHSDHASPKELERYGARCASLGEVLGGSKVVSLHKGATARVKGLIGVEELALMQRGSVLVNTARGPLMDEGALLARAAQGDMAFALDVFETEPLPARHPLRRLSNVILTPHSASSTPQCGRRVGEEALRIVKAWLEGKSVSVLSRERLQMMT